MSILQKVTGKSFFTYHRFDKKCSSKVCSIDSFLSSIGELASLLITREYQSPESTDHYRVIISLQAMVI